MAIKVKCIDKIKNGNKIVGYTIQDANGNIVNVKADYLKQAILANKIEVTNLTLTKDNKLINTNTKNTGDKRLSFSEFYSMCNKELVRYSSIKPSIVKKSVYVVEQIPVEDYRFEILDLRSQEIVHKDNALCIQFLIAELISEHPEDLSFVKHNPDGYMYLADYYNSNDFKNIVNKYTKNKDIHPSCRNAEKSYGLALIGDGIYGGDTCVALGHIFRYKVKLKNDSVDIQDVKRVIEMISKDNSYML